MFSPVLGWSSMSWLFVLLDRPCHYYSYFRMMVYFPYSLTALLPTQCTERFSCVNSSESFLEEFILKDTFSMLIKCRSFETACNSGSLKICFLEMFMLCVWAQCVPVGVLTWLIVLSTFIYILFGTPNTHSLCNQDWANGASEWSLRLLQQNQQPQPGLGHDSKRPPLTRL